MSLPADLPSIAKAKLPVSYELLRFVTFLGAVLAWCAVATVVALW